MGSRRIDSAAKWRHKPPMTNAFTPPAGPGAYQTLSALVLGSSSPRRRELLGSLGLDFEVCPSNAAEPPPLPGEAPDAYARRMARQKTLDVVALYPTCAVLGADTIVVLPGEDGADALVLGKPENEADAVRMLTLLSGRAHQVITGCCLAVPGHAEPACFAVATDVTMRKSTRRSWPPTPPRASARTRPEPTPYRAWARFLWNVWTARTPTSSACR